MDEYLKLQAFRSWLRESGLKVPEALDKLIANLEEDWRRLYEPRDSAVPAVHGG